MIPFSSSRFATWRRVVAWTLALPLLALGWAAPASAQVVISQIYGGGGNASAPYTHDFVELRNKGTAAVDLSGWSVQYASAAGNFGGQTLSTALSGLIPADGYYLVRLASGGAVGVALPAANATGTTNIGATAGKMALVNSTILLPVASCPAMGGTIVDFVGYGTTANCFEGSGPAPAPSNTTAVVRDANCQDSNQNGADFTTQAPSPRNAASPSQPCNGGGGGGGGGGGDPLAAAIYTIQGSGATSPLVGQLVVTRGVVTKLTNLGFFVQDLTGDGNPATSDGIFVLVDPALHAAAVVGNLVDVTGTVTEFNVGSGGNADTSSKPLTQLTGVSSVALQGTGYSITPTDLSLPLAVGDSFERFEGMLVRITSTMTVQQNFFHARFGQVTLGAGGRHENPTNRHPPGAQAQALAAEQARSRILLDDGSSVQNPNPTPYIAAGGVPRAGDTLASVTGVIDYGLATSSTGGAGLYRIHPTLAPVIANSHPRPPAPANVGGNMRLGAMNVLNFFTTFTDGTTASGGSGQGCTVGGSTSAGNCRGANNLTEFLRQRSKIVKALAGLNADAVGLVEIQNNASVAAQNLVDALNAEVGAGTYAVVPDPAGAGSTGTDAIKLAIIYKPARLSRVGNALSDTASVNNRPPVAQTFAAANGEKFTLVVNHLKSKGSCPSGGGVDTDQGDGQGCWNATRLQQAIQLRTFVAQLQMSSGSPDVLLVGDFNAYGQEDPMVNLISNGFVDQMLRFTPFAYSYVFDGTAGRLDHGISTASMSPRFASTTHWHINADESLAHDYNLEFKQPACATCAPDPYDGSHPYRSSDHDPLLLGVNLYKTIYGTSGRDVINGTPGDDLIVASPGADTLTGGAGNNIFFYSTMREAGDTITDFVPGKDQIDLRQLLASIGANPASAWAAGVVRLVASGAHTKLLIDTDGSAGPNVARVLLTMQNVSPASIVPSRDLGL